MPSLLNVLVAPCDRVGNEQHVRVGSLQLCPDGSDEIYRLLPQLLFALLTNMFLAVITIGVVSVLHSKPSEESQLTHPSNDRKFQVVSLLLC